MSSSPSPPPSTLEMREFDLVIFSATSFVGYFTIRELLLTIEQNSSDYHHLKWAIAGRSASKMADVVKRFCSEESDLGTSSKSAIQSIPMIVADVENLESLEEMASRTTVLVNTVGPYLLYGRPVVEACIAAGTHYIDLSAEIQFNETLQVDAHARAQEAGICVVNCAGWASVPVDLGVAYLKKNFGGGKLSSVEVQVDVKPCPKNGYRLHTGTWDSMLTVFVRYRELAAIRQVLFSDEEKTGVLPATVPYSGPKLKQQLVRFPRFCKRSSASSASPNHLEIIFPGPDVSVVRRSQHYNYRYFNEESPVQVTQYIRVRAVANQLLGFPIIFALFWHRPGRWLLKKNVELFTAGFISRVGPTRAQIEGTTCSFTLVGRGYSKETSEDPKEKEVKPDKRMKLKIECSEPAYLATSTFLVQCALSLLIDLKDVPTRGVLTSASAFQRTRLIERLRGRSISFDLESC